ncbi:hypothetical protein N2152v2_006054 [Parachlorella kessleri]
MRADDVLFCPSLKDKLQPRPSPLSQYTGAFVEDGDRVCIESLVLSSDGRRRKGHYGSHENLLALARLTSTPSFREGMAAQHRHAMAWSGVGSPLDTLREEEGKEGDEDAEEPVFDLSEMPRYALRAGPRETIHFNPAMTHIAIVTVGGLCPGLNDVIRSLVSKASDYGVPDGNIVGIRYGFKGFEQHRHNPPVPLTRANTDDIHLEGGTVLGTSNAEADIPQIVKWLDLWSIDMLFVVGGIRAGSVASSIRRKCAQHKVLTAVVAVPKSIDSDFLLIDKTFGFDTAVEESQRALLAAKTEASSAYRGVGIVKLMGKDSGLIAVKASLASGLVDVCLIPEVPFQLEGEHGLVAYLEHLLETRGHVVICIAEGTAQDLIPEDFTSSTTYPEMRDAGVWLKKELRKRLDDVDVKYIDPSLIIRSVPPTSDDRVYCKTLAHSAIHAAFAGYTGVLVGMVNTHHVLLPIIAEHPPRRVDPEAPLWRRLLASTGQPDFMG